MTLPYLLHIFERVHSLHFLKIRPLKVHLQGKRTDRIIDCGVGLILTFIARLGQWHCRVQKGSSILFPKLDIALEKRNTHFKGQLQLEDETNLSQCSSNSSVVFSVGITPNPQFGK